MGAVAYCVLRGGEARRVPLLRAGLGVKKWFFAGLTCGAVENRLWGLTEEDRRACLAGDAKVSGEDVN
jgi:hypothetical protein